MQIRTIEDNEVYKLTDCLAALTEHHNRVSLHFSGAYPSRPYEQTLELFSAALQEGRSQIAILEEQNRVVGFCKLDVTGTAGKIDYLVVMPEYRGKGCGTELVNWAMQIFRQKGVKSIEVKVVAGNDAIHFYEKYGFQINAYILRLCP